MPVFNKIFKAGVIMAFFAFLFFFAAGCWNRVEINERSFILGVTFDKPKFLEKEDSSFLSPKGSIPRYAMTVEIPIIRNVLGGGGQGGGGGDSGGGGGMRQAGNNFVVTSTGNTVWDIERALTKRLGRENFYGHMRVIILGENVAKEGIKEIFDFFIRRREIHGRIKVAVAQGEAKKILMVKPFEENFTTLYLERLFSERQRSGAKTEGDFLKIYTSLINSGNAVFPRVRAASTEQVVVGGAAVIKDWKFAGWLSELETSGVNIVNNQLMGESVTVVDPQTERGFIVVRIEHIETKRKVEVKNNKPIIFLNMIGDGTIVEKTSSNITDNESFLDQVERRVELELQRRAIHAFDKLQRKYKADIFNFGQMVAQKHPKYWKKVEKKWDEDYFSKARITVSADVRVRGMETIR